MILVNFTMTGRKQDCVCLYFDKTQVVVKVICQTMCKKCDKETQTCCQNKKNQINQFKFFKSIKIDK